VHNKDRALLELIQRSLGIGKIYKHGSNSIELRVSSVKDLLVLIDQAFFFLFAPFIPLICGGGEKKVGVPSPKGDPQPASLGGKKI
jgi:hypothetical protein